jgi:hypothetical protein
MRFPAHKMKLETRNENDCYSDYIFHDECRKGMKRLWILSLGKGGEKTYSMLLRSETDDGEFDHGVVLSKSITRSLEGLVNETQ